jgi:hypothetical protein
MLPLIQKGAKMLYKTMVLELLNQRPAMQEQLRRTGSLLPTLELYAKELKNNHEVWKELLSLAQPESNPSQIASAALEIALKKLEDRLPPASPPDATGPVSLEAAMAFVRRHTPPA